jgi:hypothetical protein
MIAREKPKRLEAAYQFRLQAEKLGFSILARPNAYTFRLQDRESGRELTAAVMAATFDFYEYRLNRAKRRADVLIVQEHNAVAPLPVLAIKDARLYDPGVASQEWSERAKRVRRNRAEAQMFLSRLLLSERAALAELAAMKPRTRQWYEAKIRTYLTAKRGRPWSS